jgi:glucose-6-phosphate 1-dehydrogenase
MAEDFGIQGRGVFYDATGTIRDVMQNHLFQVLTNLAMEPPAVNDSESTRDEKVKVLKAMPALKVENVVRGQFNGYLREPGVAPNSTTETFAALMVQIDSWRWQGVPFYIRAGKCLPVTCTEVVARFRRPPVLFSECTTPMNHLRFRVNPDVALAMGITIMDNAERGVGEQVEMLVARRPEADEMDAYERVLTDAMEGDHTIFARQDYVEEAWRIVDPVLKAGTPLRMYEPGTWGPGDVNKSVCPPDGWANPQTTRL